MSQVRFVRFVSSVTGRVVSRWDTGKPFGARITTEKERQDGAPPIVWDTERVIPLSAEFCERFARELNQAVAHGDLKERTLAEYEAQEKQRRREAPSEDASPPGGEGQNPKGRK